MEILHYIEHSENHFFHCWEKIKTYTGFFVKILFSAVALVCPIIRATSDPTKNKQSMYEQRWLYLRPIKRYPKCIIPPLPCTKREFRINQKDGSISLPRVTRRRKYCSLNYNRGVDISYQYICIPCNELLDARSIYYLADWLSILCFIVIINQCLLS